MLLDLTQADAYFEGFVVNNDAWVDADNSLKTRAVNNASKVLYRIYGYKYDVEYRPIPEEAIFEQAIWLLRIDDMMKRAEQGVTSFMVDGIQVALARIDRTIAPQVIGILGRKIGQSVSGRVGSIPRKRYYDEYGNERV